MEFSDLDTRNCVWCGPVFEAQASCVFQRIEKDADAKLGIRVQSIIDDRLPFISRVPDLTSLRVGDRQWRRRDMRRFVRLKWSKLARSPGANMRFQSPGKRFFAKVYPKSGHVHLYGMLKEAEQVHEALEYVLDVLQALWPRQYAHHNTPDASRLRLILCNSGFKFPGKISLNRAAELAPTLHGREICGFKIQNVWCGASCLLFSAAHDLNIRAFGPDGKKLYIRIYSSGKCMYVSTVLHMFRPFVRELVECLEIGLASRQNKRPALCRTPIPNDPNCGDLPILQ